MASKSQLNMSPWLFWSVGTLLYLYQFVVRVSPSVMADDWILWFSIDTAVLGTMVSFFYLSYSGMQVPLGLLFDRYGPRMLMSLAGFVIAFGCILTLVSHSIYLFAFGRLLIGLGSACGFLGTLKIATLCFPEDKIGMLAGFTTAIGTFGGIIGGAPLSVLTEFVSWQGSMFILAVLGVCIGVLAFLLLAKLPTPEKQDHLSLREGLRDMFSGLSILFHSKYAWRVGLFAFCMYTPLSAFADIWGVPFFKDAYGHNEVKAASLTGTVFLGVIMGGIFLGKIIKLLGDFYSMFFGALCSLISFALILYVPMSTPLLFVCLFILGFSFAPECIAFSLIYRALPNDRGGIAVGFTNMITMLSGVLFQPLIGWILGLFTPMSDISTYERMHYQISLTPIVMCLCFACFLAYQLRSDQP